MTIGERIKNRREELGMTQDELARKCGYKSRSSINKIELSRDLPLKKVSLMADVLQTTPGYLMGWEDMACDYVADAGGNDIFIELKKLHPTEAKKFAGLYEMYQNASPGIQAAVEQILKEAQHKSE